MIHWACQYWSMWYAEDQQQEVNLTIIDSKHKRLYATDECTVMGTHWVKFMFC